MAENKSDDKKKNFLKGLGDLVAKFFVEKFDTAKLKDGTIVGYDGDMPMEAMPIYVIPSDGSQPIPAPDGVLDFEDGTQVEVKGGIIMTVKPPAGTGAMENTLPATEAAAKKIVESVIKETTYSKQEVEDKLKVFIEELNKVKTEFAEVKKANEALTSSNETLTKELGKVSASHAELIEQNKKLEGFSKELPELLKEFGANPQTQETEEEKKKREETFNSEKPKKLTDAEWRAKYMKH